MALSLKISVCQEQDCKSIKFSEATGAYSSSNTGGWGSPNPAIADASSAVLTITFPYNSSTTTVTIPSSTLYPTFPTSTTTTEYTITSSTLALGSGLQLPDGLYTFVYTVMTTSGEFTTGPIRVLMYCQVECCVNNLLAKVATEGCDCSDETVDIALEGYFWLQALKAAADCGNTTAVNNILDILDRICDYTSCNCS